MTAAWGWTKADFLGLTLRQLRYYQNEGKPPKPRSREFASFAEARAYHASLREGSD